MGNTEVIDLSTSSNGRDYQLIVGLPGSYSTEPGRRYPVAYVTDGYWNFIQLLASFGTLTYDEAMPETVLVGISYSGSAPDYNALRTLDLTPGVDPFFDPAGNRSGHAAEFVSVIANQIVPYVDANYRTDTSYRVLAGSSFGGLFTVFAMFERPGLFQAYVAGSPSLGWGSDRLTWGSARVPTMETSYSRTHSALPARLFMTFGTEDISETRTSTRLFFNQIRSRSYSGLSVALREIEGERHSGSKIVSLHRGLRYAFAPLAPSPPTLNPGFGNLGKLVAVSTRGLVGGTGSELIAGLAVEGFEPKRFLVRAAGPALLPLSVPDVLPDPILRVVDARGDEVARNDDWTSDAELASDIRNAVQTVGVFPFPEGSNDAALVVTLAPGAYTAVVSSATGELGNGLVEAYELVP